MVIDCKGFVYSKLIGYVISILLFFFPLPTFDLSFPNSNRKKQVVVFPHSVEALRSIT